MNEKRKKWREERQEEGKAMQASAASNPRIDLL